jgi:plastocyanin
MAQTRQIFSRARRAALVVIAGLFFSSGAACGGGGGGSSGGSNIPTDPTGGSNSGGNTGGTNRSLSVTVANNTYTPGTTTVSRGSTVQWTWNTCTGDGYSQDECVQHSVTFDDGPTSQLQDRGTFSRTFNAAGTYKYHCTAHGLAMSGQVTVE